MDAKVVSRQELAPGIIRMRFLTGQERAAAAKPGQFLNVYPMKGSRMILPRPFGICAADAEEGTMDIVFEIVGNGTAALAAAEPGTSVRIAAPLGRGFDYSGLAELQKTDSRPVVLAGGGVGCAPLLFLAAKLQEESIAASAVLGFREYPFLSEDFIEAGCDTTVTTEKANEPYFQGTIIDCMEVHGVKAPAYFSCGPKGMLAAVSRYAAADCGEDHLQVSLEERMGCGYGVCVGCSTWIRETDEAGEVHVVHKKVCSDGPVFKGCEVIWND